MTLDDFKLTLQAARPPSGLPELLLALWYDATDNWEQAHIIAQDDTSDNGSWIHGYLHRREGDLGNATYWYRRAGKSLPRISLEHEWEEIVKTLLSKDRKP